jgi:hypothetical protein
MGGDQGLHHRHRTQRVGVEHLADVRHGSRFKGADDADARIVHENVNSSGSVEDRSDAFIARDVQRQDSQPTGTRQDVGVRCTHGGDDVPAIGQEVTGRLKAVARGRTGNQDRLHGDIHLFGHEAMRARAGIRALSRASVFASWMKRVRGEARIERGRIVWNAAAGYRRDRQGNAAVRQ